MTHKFHLDQLVQLANPRFASGQPGTSGMLQVTRLMPADETGEFSYRVKSVGVGASERAVRESDLRAGNSRT
jgi:hypothetical protein